MEKNRAGNGLIPGHRPGCGHGTDPAGLGRMYQLSAPGGLRPVAAGAADGRGLPGHDGPGRRIQQDQVTAMVRQVEETFGPVSLLVNNAGVAGQALFQDITPELWHRYFSVNVDGAFHTIQAVLPNMIHEKEGCIINTSSIWGQRGASCEVTYSLHQRRR